MLALFQVRFRVNTCYILDWIFVMSTIDNASRYIVYRFNKTPCTLQIEAETKWPSSSRRTIFRNVSSWARICEFRARFHWSVFLRVELTIFRYWFSQWNWRLPGQKPLSEPIMVSLMTHLRVTGPQLVKTLCPVQQDQHFADGIFKGIFLNDDYCIQFKFNLILFLGCNWQNPSIGLYKELGAEQATSRHLSQWRPI